MIDVPPTPPLPEGATPSTERVYADLAFCSALHRAAGDDGTVIYAVDWAGGRLGLSGKTVSVALRWLRTRGAVHRVKTLSPIGEGLAGVRVYALGPPPRREVRPAGALTVEADRSSAVDQGEEPGEDVAVLEAVAADRREVTEGDDGAAAAGDEADGAAAIGGSVIEHRFSRMGNVPPDGTSSHGAWQDEEELIARLIETFDAVELPRSSGPQLTLRKDEL